MLKTFMQTELQLLNSFEADNNWLNSNYVKFQKEYPNEFVAISNEKIVGFGKNIENVVKALQSKGIDAASVLIEFIPEHGLKIIV